MIRFAHPEFLYLLLILPLLVLASLLLFRRQQRDLTRFGDLGMLQNLSGHPSRSRKVWKFSLYLAAMACLVLGLANPRIGTRLKEVKLEGVDFFIALDVSLSMKAEDLKPNRLEKAKMEIRKLLRRLEGDRLGLIVFAGEAYTQFPLTTDYGAAHLFLDAVDVDSVPVPGTSIESAVERAMESFDFKAPTTKVLAILTDGEATEGQALDAVRKAADKGVRIYTLGMGSPNGAPIPLYQGGGKPADFKRDKAGSVVVSRLDETGLDQLATTGKGRYLRASNGQDELETLYKEIHRLDKQAIGTKQFTDFEDRFQYFLFPALLLLLLESLIPAKGKGRWSLWNPLRKSTILLILGTFPLMGESPRSLVQGGNRLYKAEKFSEAEINYRKALEKSPASLQAQFDLGNALYKQGRYEDAAKIFGEVAQKAQDKSLKAQAFYNLGNAQLKSQKTQEAVASYIESLKRQPKDAEAKYNLSYALAQQQEQQNQKNKSNQNQQDKQDKNQQNKDKNQQKQDQDPKDKNQQKQQSQNKENEKNKTKEQAQQEQKKMSKEQAERMLEQIRQTDQDARKKQKQQLGGRPKSEKDW